MKGKKTLWDLKKIASHSICGQVYEDHTPWNEELYSFNESLNDKYQFRTSFWDLNLMVYCPCRENSIVACLFCSFLFSLERELNSTFFLKSFSLGLT